MLYIIGGNICSLLAMITDSFSSSRKTARGVLLVQCLSQAIYCSGSILLRGYSAAVQNAVSILRNIAAARGKQPRWVEWALVALGVALGAAFNNLGLIGWLPILGNLEYSVCVFRFKDNERALKLSFVLCVLCYVVFNAVIMNFVGVIANAVVMGVTIAYLINNRKGVNAK